MKHITRGIAIVISIVLLWSAIRVGREVFDAILVLRANPSAARNGAHLLGHINRANADPINSALVLVYSPECGACNVNMSDWIEIIARLRHSKSSFPVIALAPSEIAYQGRGYWRNIARFVALDSVEVEQLLDTGVDATPATLLFDRGRLVLNRSGVLSAQEKADLVERILGFESDQGEQGGNTNTKGRQ